ncbi:MAG: hypothetical protein WED15_02650 [Akkermansiaceae bacterium]
MKLLPISQRQFAAGHLPDEQSPPLPLISATCSTILVPASCFVWISLISGALAYFCGLVIGGIAAGALLLVLLTVGLMVALSSRRDAATPDNFLHEHLTSPPRLKDSSACMKQPVKSN